MKKRTKLVLISQDQMKREPWLAFAQIQQQSKTATISVDEDMPAASPDAVVEAIAAADPLRATVGSTMVQALKAKDGFLVALASIPAVSLIRRILVVPGEVGADINAQLDAAVNCVKSAELTFDGGAQNNAPMTNAVANGTGISTQVNAALAAAKPTFSVQSIVNKLEDLLAATAGAHTGVVLIDQGNEKVYLWTCPVANEATLLAEVNTGAPAGLEAIAAFKADASPQASTEGEFGE